MSTNFIIIVSIISIIVWIIVSKEAMKASEKISRFKMITLLCIGVATTSLIVISCVQKLIA